MLRNRLGSGVLGAILMAWAAAGCGGEADDVETEVSSAIIDNALTANALTANALTANALTANALTANALTANALTANALTANALRDPLGRELLKYIVSCALDDDQEVTVRVDGKKYTFEGSLGLATGWGESRGSCDGECQRWVSACVLSRVDYKGVKVSISIRGEHPALRPEWGEMRDYTVAEGAYFGNLFVKNQPRYLCLAPGQDDNQRVCGPSLKDCPMTVVGSCEDACAHTGPYRSFSECSSSGEAGRYRVYDETITVFLKKG
jgi:hypothetical protein